MDASRINRDDARPLGDGFATEHRIGQASIATPVLAMRWAALHDAAAVVASIAGSELPSAAPVVRDFPGAILAAGPDRRAIAERAIDDLMAMMEPGLGALLSASASGVDVAAAAAALLHEFVAARDALLKLLPPAPRSRPVA